MTKTTEKSQTKWYRSLTKIVVVITSVILTIEPGVAAIDKTAVVMMTDYHYNKEADIWFEKLIRWLSDKYTKIVIVMNGDNEVKTAGEYIWAKTLGMGTRNLNHKQIPTNEMIAQWRELNHITGMHGRDEVEKSIVQGEVAARLFYDTMHRVQIAHGLRGPEGPGPAGGLRTFLNSYTEGRQTWYGENQITTHGKILESFQSLSDGGLKKDLLALLRKLHDRSGPKPRCELLEKIHDLPAVTDIIIGLGNHEIALQKNLGFYMTEMKRRCNKVNFVATMPWTGEGLNGIGIEEICKSKDRSLGFVQWMDPVKLRLDSGDLLAPDHLQVTKTTIMDGGTQREINVLNTTSYEKRIRECVTKGAKESVKHLFVLAHQDLCDVEVEESYKTVEGRDGGNKTYYDHEGMYTLDKLDAKSVMSRIIERKRCRIPMTVVCGHGHKAGRKIEQLDANEKVNFVTPDPYGISVAVVAIDRDGEYSAIEDLESWLRTAEGEEKTSTKQSGTKRPELGPRIERYGPHNLIARVRLRNVDDLVTKQKQTVADIIKKQDSEGEISFKIGEGPSAQGIWDLDE
jgi:hypothetical protein